MAAAGNGNKFCYLHAIQNRKFSSISNHFLADHIYNFFRIFKIRAPPVYLMYDSVVVDLPQKCVSQKCDFHVCDCDFDWPSIVIIVHKISDKILKISIITNNQINILLFRPQRNR